MLTRKQVEFCQNVVSGMTAIDAYMHAYNSKSKNCANVESSKLLKRDDVKAKIDALYSTIAKRTTNRIISERDKKRQICYERMQACIDRGDDTNARGWLDILNRMDAEYININRNITEEQTPIAQLDTEALARIANAAIPTMTTSDKEDVG